MLLRMQVALQDHFARSLAIPGAKQSPSLQPVSTFCLVLFKNMSSAGLERLVCIKV